MAKMCGVALAVSLLVSASPARVAPPRAAPLPVLPRVDVTVLVENMAGSGRVLGEWGLSYLVEACGRRILLDAGGGSTLAGNAAALGVDLAKVGAIVVSHGHGDHAGGLAQELAACGPVPVFIHPAAWAARYVKDPSGAVQRLEEVSKVELDRLSGKVVAAIKPAAVCEGVMTTGEVPRRTPFEDASSGGFLDEGLTAPDSIPDDQALYFRVPQGVVVLLGCAHAGVVNTLRYVSELTGETKLHAVMGGTHLISASPARLRETVEAFRELDVRRILLGHCTGIDAYAAFAEAFPGRCGWPAAGTSVRFGN